MIETFKKVIADTCELKPCGFKHWKTCHAECRYFETCTRNPYRKYENTNEEVKNGSDCDT